MAYTYSENVTREYSLAAKCPLCWTLQRGIDVFENFALSGKMVCLGQVVLLFKKEMHVEAAQEGFNFYKSKMPTDAYSET